MHIGDSELAWKEKEPIFGVTEVSKSNIAGMELRYEVWDKSVPDSRGWVRQRVYRDKDGNYYLAVKGGRIATVMLSLETYYHPYGREVLIPIRPEALAIWFKWNMRNADDRERALEELKVFDYTRVETVWSYQQNDVYEFLAKTDTSLYIFFSTDDFYPCPGFNMPYFGCDENGIDNSRDDLYIFYVTPETARRWAEARGMDAAICQTVFEKVGNAATAGQ